MTAVFPPLIFLCSEAVSRIENWWIDFFFVGHDILKTKAEGRMKGKKNLSSWMNPLPPHDEMEQIFQP